ncbi:hypothetical protein [Prevotella sp.]|uniref:hypothetical protein n=1 Tax=Prevotella sp. TaxID=59823 RepID=UPI001CABAA20|nr:hypothetical protein [Prevotella sp.]MBF1640703.1 hypothetical protein [Prevotella sp.]
MGTLYASASVVYKGAGETGVMMNQNVVSVKVTPTKKALSKDERAAISLITSMYNTKGFENGTYLKSHCTKKLLKELKAAYDYEYDAQPDAYAGWLFRSGAQDGPSNAHKILRVVSLGNNWYQYTFLDMGIKCTNKVKVIKVGNKLLFDEIKQGKI